MDHSKSKLDTDFELLLSEFQGIIKSNYSANYLKKIKLVEVMKMGQFIKDLEPKFRIREYKTLIISYLEIISSSKDEIDEKEIWKLIKEKLIPVINYLNTNHDFYARGSLIFTGLIIGILIDGILTIVGIAKYYYYIPFFTLFYATAKIRKYYHLKKQGKILNL